MGNFIIPSDESSYFEEGQGYPQPDPVLKGSRDVLLPRFDCRTFRVTAVDDIPGEAEVVELLEVSRYLEVASKTIRNND